jgi:hypothetical protein
LSEAEQQALDCRHLAICLFFGLSGTARTAFPKSTVSALNQMKFKAKAVQQFKHFPQLRGCFALFKLNNKFPADISGLGNLFLRPFEMFTLFEKILSQF